MDITDRLQAQNAPAASERRLRLLLEHLPVGVVVHDADTRVVEANPMACRILGLSEDQMFGRTAVDPAWAFLEADGTPMEHGRFPVAQVLGTGEPLWGLMGGVRRPDRPRPVWVLCNGYPLRGADDRIEQVVITFADITERKEAEDGLQATLDALPDLLFELDGDGRVHAFHSSRAELLLLPAEEQVGRTVDEVLPAAAAGVVLEALRAAARDGTSSGLQYELDIPGGGRRWFELSVSRKRRGSDPVARFMMLARDVTDRRRAEFERQALEFQLRESQKMESIGTLAGGIAHDFNNILAAILGNVALAREDVGPAHPALASLDQVQRAGLRARHLVQQILAFSRHEHAGLVVQPLGPVVEETLGLLRATLPASVRLETRLPTAPVPARVDATQMQQVLMNLCTNAWHALPGGGGRVEVGLAAATPEDPLFAAHPDLTAAASAHLWVRDEGAGMDESIRARIFDPFFTTKPVGQGTGLGLSVVHGIVREHGGAIVVDSTPGRGSTFHILLPLAESEPLAQAPDATTRTEVRGEGQRVLYIDDDEVMALLVERLLDRAGFAATASTSPVAALELLRAAPQAFDVVVTDYNMPEMSGLELTRTLLELRPGLPVVLSSGHISDALREQAEALGVRGVLRKEHTLEELTALLHSVLPAPGECR